MHTDWAPGMIGMMTLLTVSALRLAFSAKNSPEEQAQESSLVAARD